VLFSREKSYGTHFASIFHTDINCANEQSWVEKGCGNPVATTLPCVPTENITDHNIAFVLLKVGLVKVEEVGHGGSLVDSSPFVRRVTASI